MSERLSVCIPSYGCHFGFRFHIIRWAAWQHPAGCRQLLTRSAWHSQSLLGKWFEFACLSHRVTAAISPTVQVLALEDLPPCSTQFYGTVRYCQSFTYSLPGVTRSRLGVYIPQSGLGVASFVAQVNVDMCAFLKFDAVLYTFGIPPIKFCSLCVPGLP